MTDSPGAGGNHADGAVSAFNGSRLNEVGNLTKRSSHAHEEGVGGSRHHVDRRNRDHRGLGTSNASIAVLVQALIPADVSAVIFSANPITGSRDEVMINASWGLGESIVGGTVTPDMYVLRKHDLGLESHFLGTKKKMTVLHADGTQEVDTPASLQQTRALTEDEATAMAELALRIEAEMGWAVDLECAIAAGELHLLQCRPITTLR